MHAHTHNLSSTSSCHVDDFKLVQLSGLLDPVAQSRFLECFEQFLLGFLVLREQGLGIHVQLGRGRGLLGGSVRHGLEAGGCEGVELEEALLADARGGVLLCAPRHGVHHLQGQVTHAPVDAEK